MTSVVYRAVGVLFTSLILTLPSCDAQRTAREHVLLSSSTPATSARSAASASAAPSRGAPVTASVPSLRPILPQSGGVVASGRVIFVWQGADSTVELARNRELTDQHLTLQGSPMPPTPGRTTALSPELADGIWFWRVSNAAATEHSHVWLFRVQHVAGVSSGGSQLDGTDVNCDGKADILVNGAVLLGGDPPTATVQCSLGSLEIAALKPDPEFPDFNWGPMIGLGDVDGDGCADAALLVAHNPHREASPPKVCLWFRGRPGLSGLWPAAGLCPARGLGELGDINNDGYADATGLIGTGCPGNGCAAGLYLGGPSGLQLQASPQTFPDGNPLLASGDFNGDGFVDLWAVKAPAHAGEATQLQFFSGTQPFLGATPVKVLELAAVPFLETLSAGIVGSHNWGLLGFGKNRQRLVAWEADSVNGKIDETRMPTVLKTLQSSSCTGIPDNSCLSWGAKLVPFAGPGRRGVWVFPATPAVDVVGPKPYFLQYSFDARGTARFLGKLTVSSSAEIPNLAAAGSFGDVDGDGFNDLSMGEIAESTGQYCPSLFRGSATGFRFGTGILAGNASPFPLGSP